MRSLLVACLLVAQMQPAFAYMKLGVQIGDRVVTLKWNRPVRYFVTDAGARDVSAADLQSAIGRAFSTWQAVPTASIAYEFAGFTTARPLDEDGRSTIGFAAMPDLDRVLASTSFLIDDATGELVESDIFFNSTFAWSVSARGEPGEYDLESIALHESGHLSGLGHSAIGETEQGADGRRVLAAESVLFPIAFPAGSIAGRTLKADDIAGISDIYPEADFARTIGSISGRVTKGGRGVFGAHVVAFNPDGGALVGGFTFDQQGRFSIAGLRPGPHVIRVEPVDDASVDSFFDATGLVDLDFRVIFFDRLVVVPRGGDSGPIEVKVVGK